MTKKNAGERFKEILAKMEEEDKLREDITAPINSIRAREDFTFVGDDVGEIKMTEHAFSQLCSNLYSYNLPAEYFRKLHKEDPQRFTEQFNYHLERGRGVNRRFRGIKDKDGQIEVRGIVSEQYIPYDNLDVLSIFMDTAKELPEFELMNDFTNDKMMFLRLGFPTTSQSFGQTIDGKDDKNFLALDLLNSEVGAVSIIANPAIYRLVCTNGMVAKKAQYGNFKQRHMHINPVAVNEKLRTSIMNGVNTGAEMLDKFRQAREIKIDNPYEYITHQAKGNRYSDKMIDEIKASYNIESEKSLYGVVNAFTRTATNITSVDRRLDLEKSASKILDEGLKVRA